MAYVAASIRFLQSIRYILAGTPLSTGHDNGDRSTLCLRLVLIGQSGTGKTNTANSLAEVCTRKPVHIVVSSGIVHRVKSVFQAERGHHNKAFKIFQTGVFGNHHDKHRSCQSVTVEAYEFDLKELQIIITPGLRKNLPEEYIMTELSNCLTMAAPGPHAFLLFVQIGFSDPHEVAQQMNAIKDIFGKEFVKHTVVVFTGADSLKKEDKSILEYVEKLDGEFKRFLEECKGRYVAFDNTILWDPNKKPIPQDKIDNVKQSHRLVNAVTKMVNENKGAHYSDRYYQRASSIQEDKKDTDEAERIKLLLASKEVEQLKVKIRQSNQNYKGSCTIL